MENDLEDSLATVTSGAGGKDLVLEAADFTFDGGIPGDSLLISELPE